MNMPDTDGSEPVADVKTGVDAEIESLKQQLNDMKSSYESVIKEQQEANKQLYAMIHPVPSANSIEVQADTAPVGFDFAKAADVFYSRYGARYIEPTQ